jgi:Fe(3+) dicitrate transport protein
LKVIDLKEVRISGTHSATGVERLPDIEGATINAGKKNEVIVLGVIDADLSTNNARQVLAKVPGVTVWENDGSGIQVGVAARGLSPNRSWEFNVRQDGTDICAEVFGYPEAYYSPPMEGVERIEFIRGAASLQYGPQFGGLMNYRMKKGDPSKPVVFETKQTLGSYGLFNSYNALGGTKGKFTYYAFWHHRTADGWRANSRYTTNTGHFSMTYAASSKVKLGLEYTHMEYESQQPGGHTDSSFAVDARASTRERNWFGTPWNVAALSAEVKFTERAHLDVKLFSTVAQRNSVGFMRPIFEPDTFITALGSKAPRQVDRDDYTNVGAEVRFLQGYQLGGQRNSLAVGARVYHGHTQRHQRGVGTTGSDYDLTIIGERYGRELDMTTTNVALFAENLFRIGDRLSIVPGVRYEFITSTVEGYINTSGRSSPAISRCSVSVQSIKPRPAPRYMPTSVRPIVRSCIPN